ncbi:Protein kinase superfamily protein [Euphorbia peplus]|nr:Protein kinase superfamily protein [Euphorbia peplus]
MESSHTETAAPASHALKHHHSHFHSHKTIPHHSILSSTSIFIIIISAISLIVLIAILLLIIMLRRLKSTTKGSASITNTTSTCRFISHTTINVTSSPDVKGGCLYVSNLGNKPLRKHKAVQVFTYKELEVATDTFSDANVIGNGSYGTVYRGVVADGSMVAIKMLRRQGKQGERAFRVEVDLLSRLHSPYLVELLGYCADQHHRLLIFEFMANGTLQNHLHHKPHQPLDWGTRLQIALDCARALEFLHEFTVPSVIHRDLKCTNILLDQHFHAKVSDFGSAKMGSDRINGQTSTTRVVGTTGYLAPEYASTGKLTTKSDVYSYGVVLLQLLTGRIPIDTRRPSGEHVLVSWALPRLTDREKVVEMVDPALKGHYLKKDLVQVAAIAAMCVQPEADYRPLMTDVVQSLIPLIKNLSGSSRFHNNVPRTTIHNL